MKKYMPAYLLVATILIAGCQQPLDAQVSAPIHSDLEITQDRHVPLHFTAIENQPSLAPIPQETMAEVIRAEPVAGGRIFIYTIDGDEETLYGAFENTEGIHPFGTVGQRFPQMDDELLSVAELDLFHTTVIRVNGVFGANAPVHNYLSMVDGHMKPFLRVDTGHAVELDLDQDGTAEIISTHGTPMQTFIYKWQDGQFFIADVNEALGAASVYLNDEKSFDVQLKFSDPEVQRFAYSAGALGLINEQ